MVAQHVSPESKAMKVAQKNDPQGGKPASGPHDERRHGPQPSNNRPPPVRGTPADPGPGGPAIPGAPGPDGLPAPVNPSDEEGRDEQARRVRQRLEQANQTGRGPGEEAIDLNRGNIDRAEQYINSARTQAREAWDNDDHRAFDAALRDLDSALTEMGRKG